MGLDFDCVIPVPLSPDKAKNRELHRTRALAQELARLVGADVLEALSLVKPVSKKDLRVRQGMSAPAFEDAYSAALRVASGLEFRRALLVDDVATDGSTLRCAYLALKREVPTGKVATSTAGLMIKKAVVADESKLVAV